MNVSHDYIVHAVATKVKHHLSNNPIALADFLAALTNDPNSVLKKLQELIHKETALLSVTSRQSMLVNDPEDATHKVLADIKQFYREELRLFQSH